MVIKIGFIADSKKIAGIFKNSEVIEQSAKTVENTLKSTIKSTGNYIKTKCMEIVQDTAYFTLDEITHLSNQKTEVIKFSVDSHDEDEARDVYNGILDIEDCDDPVAVQNILESEIDP